MKSILFSAALGTMLVAGFCLQPPVRATAAPMITATTASRQGGGKVYKLEGAGIQFLVPAGWKVEKDKDGAVTVSKQEGESFVVAVFTLLPPDAAALTPEEQFKAFSEGASSSMRKDFKELKVEEPAKMPQNGIPATIQSFKGKQNGVDMAGGVILLSAAKPVGLFMYGMEKLPEDFDKEASALFASIRKVE